MKITRNDEILAHHTTESCMSRYGQEVWIVEDETPEPGPAIWHHEEKQAELDVLGVLDGWLVVKQPDGYLAGIIWSDGGYYADVIVDADGKPVAGISFDDLAAASAATPSGGCYQVNGTIQMGQLGSIVAVL